MQEMPRPRPPYLNRAITRHGRAVWYVRVGHGDHRSRVRLRAEYGTPEFDFEYRAALAGQEAVKDCAAAVGTLAWLIERYRETTPGRHSRLQHAVSGKISSSKCSEPPARTR
jgi:hypothetical protein